MNNLNPIEVLKELKADKEYVSLVAEFISEQSASFDMSLDDWNVIGWEKKIGKAKTLTLPFYKVNHDELRALAKIYIIDNRATKEITGNSAIQFISPIKYVSTILGARPISKLTTADLYDAEKLICNNHNGTAPKRISDYLASFSIWLNIHIGISVDYQPTLTTVNQHGRRATDEQRDSKLISTSILKCSVPRSPRDIDPTFFR